MKSDRSGSGWLWEQEGGAMRQGLPPSDVTVILLDSFGPRTFKLSVARPHPPNAHTSEI